MSQWKSVQWNRRRQWVQNEEKACRHRHVWTCMCTNSEHTPRTIQFVWCKKTAWTHSDRQDAAWKHNVMGTIRGQQPLPLSHYCMLEAWGQRSPRAWTNAAITFGKRCYHKTPSSIFDEPFLGLSTKNISVTRLHFANCRYKYRMCLLCLDLSSI